MHLAVAPAEGRGSDVDPHVDPSRPLLTRDGDHHHHSDGRYAVGMNARREFVLCTHLNQAFPHYGSVLAAVNVLNYIEAIADVTRGMLDDHAFGRDDGEGGVVRLSLWNYPGDGIPEPVAEIARRLHVVHVEMEHHDHQFSLTKQ